MSVGYFFIPKLKTMVFSLTSKRTANVCIGFGVKTRPLAYYKNPQGRGRWGFVLFKKGRAPYSLSLMTKSNNPVFELMLSSNEIILSVFSTPSISLMRKITSLACEASRQRILAKMPYFPVARCATVTSGTERN